MAPSVPPPPPSPAHAQEGAQTAPIIPDEVKERIATPRLPDPDGPGRKVLVCVAWPYANGPLHLGHIAGSLLPPDIFARYHRMAGDQVLMVSGSDCHGTPILLTAEKQGLTPQEVVDRYNREHVAALKDFGIAFDIFTKTTTDNHRENVQRIFTTLLEQGYLETRTAEAPYDPKNQRFLPDRYVEGTCPHCGYYEARGDQCDECGKTLDPHELVDPYPKGHKGERIEFRETEHFYLLLSRFQDRLKAYVGEQAEAAGWRGNTVNFTQNWLNEGLQDRPITRDLTWGVPIPLEGYDDKRLYVWFEAVCGYYTSTKEWASDVAGRPEAWKAWWEDPETESVYFLGKDNIPFHTIIWPAILLGYSDGREARGQPRLVLPHDVPANEFLNLEGKQFSKSRGIGIWVHDIVGHFDPDLVRYYLAVNMPEQRDTNWTWEDFVDKVNNELVDTFGNLAHRSLTMAHKHHGAVPPAGELAEADLALIERIQETHATVTDALAHSRFKQGLRSIMALAQDGNRYFADSQPWKLLKEDEVRAATVLNTSLRLVRALDLMIAPYLPFASDRLWRMLGHEGSVHEAAWSLALEPLQEGQALPQPEVLFRKLDLQTILKDGADADGAAGDEAGARKTGGKKGKGKAANGKTNAGKAAASTKTDGADKMTQATAETTDNGQITIDEFARMELRVARVKSVEEHPNADKLYVVKLDVGELGERQVCAGLKAHYQPEEMVGKQVVLVANLKPAKLRGVESQGMILAGDDGETVAFLTPEKALPEGAKVR